MVYILGISAFYHDSAACLLKDGEIIAATQEERFSRKKFDSDFPLNSIKYCLDQAKINFNEINFIGFYDKPFLKFERLLETYLEEAPLGFQSFAMAIPVWLKEKLFLKYELIEQLSKIQVGQNTSKKIIKKTKREIEAKLLFGEHHGSHASSCFYPSPFEEAAILTLDGVGEWVTTALAYGKKNKIDFLKEIHFPHSLGLLYSAITYFTGFKVNSGEYKVMGLAPYGEPKYVSLIKEKLIDIKDDGSFRLDMSYFNYTTGLTMTSKKMNRLFNRLPRRPESEITQFEMDLARSIQEITEEIVIKLAKTIKKITNSDNLVMAGGVALNCVANGKLQKEQIFKKIWIQPASGDAGGALGVAMSIFYDHLKTERLVIKDSDSMKGCFLGKEYSYSEIKEYLDKVGANYIVPNKPKEFNKIIADSLNHGEVVGWHQGRMEFGPRALGARSIIGDARNPKMQRLMNLKIKYRESFRPFAPVVLREKITNYFEITDIDSPYMLLTAPVKKSLRKKISKEESKFNGIKKLNIIRSEIPAVTHVDYSARIQTVSQDTNPKFYDLIKEFEKQTGTSMLINTSFNVRGEPIVCSPEESYNCFMKTEMDLLAIGEFILFKKDQKKVKK